jgi:parallel beta-helix repeat protein
VLVAQNVVHDNATKGTVANGGGIAVVHNGTGNASIFDNNAVHNTSSGTSALGLGIYASAAAGSTVWIENNTVANNLNSLTPAGAMGIGTNASLGGVVFIKHNTISGNFGGIIVSGSGTTEVNDNTVVDNLGSGINVNGSRGGVFRIVRNIITANHTSTPGGGVYLNAQMGATIVLDSCIIDSNLADLNGGGVGIFARSGGTIIIQNTTVSSNRAFLSTRLGSGYGGGIWVDNDGGHIKLDQVTVSANVADIDGGGAWINSKSNDELAILRSTLTLNAADSDSNGTGNGSGVRIQRGNIRIDQTIVAANSGVIADVSLEPGATLNATHSLIGSNNGNGLTEAPLGAPDANGNLIGGSVHGVINPKLGPLANNGGPTLTRAPLPGSPAINAGDPAALAGQNGIPTSDQRGAPFTRVSGGRIDIGAVESQPNPLPGDYNLDGTVDAGDYLVWRHSKGSTSNLAADGNGNGQIDDGDFAIWRAHFGEVRQPSSAGLDAALPPLGGAATLSAAGEATGNHASTSRYAALPAPVFSTTSPAIRPRLADAPPTDPTEPCSAGLLAWLSSLNDDGHRPRSSALFQHDPQLAAIDGEETCNVDAVWESAFTELAEGNLRRVARL